MLSCRALSLKGKEGSAILYPTVYRQHVRCRLWDIPQHSHAGFFPEKRLAYQAGLFSFYPPHNYISWPDK
ncbi:hypothetical protein EAM_P211 (plasmid) [Erwinia amylovora ATCC 49946]|nr:hypothetical protein EAM_P211 [Erwinia amylovora ATCC 49946]